MSHFLTSNHIVSSLRTTLGYADRSLPENKRIGPGKSLGEAGKTKVKQTMEFFMGWLVQNPEQSQVNLVPYPEGLLA
jgi:hypothetical protein